MSSRAKYPYGLRALVVAGLILLFQIAPTSRVAADCNGNGVEDVEDIQLGTSEDCNSNLVPDECEMAPIEFFVVDDRFRLDETPRAIVAEDFDGDSRLDIAVGVTDGFSPRASKITTLLNQGGEVFEELHVDAGTDLSSLDTADVDSDGRLDFVTANSTSITVIRNAGDVNWDAAVEYAVPQFTRAAIAEDVNGDGHPDLVALNSQTNRVYVLANLGDGSFASFEEHPIGVARTPRGLAAADVDGDGDVDLILLSEGSRDLTVLYNFGTARFQAQTIASYSSAPSVEVRTGDLDGDGDVDITAQLTQGFTIHVNNGRGRFTTEILSTTAPQTTAISDLDGDGDLDLLIGDGTGRRIDMWVDADGSRFVPAGSFLFGSRFLAPGDFDGDGDEDLSAVVLDPAGVTLALNGEKRGLSLSTETYPVGGNVHSAMMLDMDGDALDDLVTSNGPDLTVSVVPSAGDGSFLAPRLLPVDSPGHLQGITGGDWDGDGDNDLAVVDRAEDLLSILLNDGTGDASTFQSYPTSQFPLSLSNADLDGDGDADLAVACPAGESVSVFMGLGDGSFAPRVDYRVSGNSPGLAVDDLDSDGDVDLVVPRGAEGSVSVLWNDGSGNFDDSLDLPLPGKVPFWVITPDVNGDALPDVVVASSSSSVSTLVNRGNQSFVVQGHYDLIGTPWGIWRADYDLDGIIDLAFACYTENVWEWSVMGVLSGRGDGSFGLPVVLHSTPGQLRFVLTTDLDSSGTPDLVAVDRIAAEATVFFNASREQIAEADFVEEICTELGLFDMSVAIRNGRSDRSVKFTAPARDDPTLLPTVYQNARRFELHQEFLAAVFPDRFPGLDTLQYNQLTGQRATRDYYVGVISRLHREAGGFEYGFRVAVDDTLPGELLSQDEVRGLYETLKESFQLEPLGYFPATIQEREAVVDWPADPGFPIFTDDSTVQSDYVAYTRGVGYGRVRIVGAGDLSGAIERGEVSFQNILVLEESPRDIEGVVSGVITAQPQVALSHLAIRTARRGTPNAFVGAAHVLLSEFEGDLVRLEVRDDTYDIRPAETAEAEAFWAENRPRLSQPPTLDPDFAELLSLEEIAAMNAEAGAQLAVSRFGGKATNLARLQTVLTGPFAEYEERGFAIPMRYYLEFMSSNSMPSALDPEREVTYAAYLEELFSSDLFNSDPSLRFEALDDLRDHIRDFGFVDPALVEAVAARIREVFETPDTLRVSFRSSSNIEDDIQFNGAGLYDSTSGCIADDFDADMTGPSHCDPSRENERGVTRALKRVWASLWNFRAYEERAFFSIDQRLAAMGVLVNRTFIDEASNGVAFTGNASNELDRRYLVTSQLGEESVVSPEPGVLAETVLVEMADGEVVDIVRAVPSSLVPEGVQVVSDLELDELGRLMAHIDRTLPLDTGGFDRSRVLLDFEFKFMSDGELAVKQVRPFLFSQPPPPTPTFELVIPEPTVVCGIFANSGASRGPREEYAWKSEFTLRPGTHALPTSRSIFRLDVIDAVRFGPEAEDAVALEEGRFQILRVSDGPGLTVYRFTFSQKWQLADGRVLDVKIVSPLEYRARGETVVSGSQTLDDAFFIRLPNGNLRHPDEAAFQADLDGLSAVRVGSCSYASLPLWEIEAEIEDGSSLVLEERFEDSPRKLFDSVPASLRRAELSLGTARRVVSDYYKLVYSSDQHNVNIRYWAVLDPPVTLDGVASPIHAVELASETTFGDPPSARYLDANFETISELAVTRYERRELVGVEPRFLRGDANADGGRNIADVSFILNYLFLRGASPSCRQAADTNDDGRLNLADAVDLLFHVFQSRVVIPEPFADCGRDETADGLSCQSHRACD